MGILDSFKRIKLIIFRTHPKMRYPLSTGRCRFINGKVWRPINNRLDIRRIEGGPGKSGMGIVYIGYDLLDKEPFALKTFQDKFLQDQVTITRFKKEAETWIRLEKHRTSFKLKYVTEINGKPYIFLEYVAGMKGMELTWIAGSTKKGLSLPLALNFAIQFCQGMRYAEDKFNSAGSSFIHLDIKPSNI